MILWKSENIGNLSLSLRFEIFNITLPLAHQNSSLQIERSQQKNTLAVSNYSCMLISSKWSRVSLESCPLDTVSLGGDEKPIESHRPTWIFTKFVVKGYLFPPVFERLGHVPSDKLTYLSASRCIELVRQSNTSRSELFRVCFSDLFTIGLLFATREVVR